MTYTLPHSTQYIKILFGLFTNGQETAVILWSVNFNYDDNDGDDAGGGGGDDDDNDDAYLLLTRWACATLGCRWNIIFKMELNKIFLLSNNVSSIFSLSQT